MLTILALICYHMTLMPLVLLHIIHIQVCATLSALMCYQATLTGGCLITHITRKCYQVIMLAECLITHIRGTWKLTTYLLMFNQPIQMPKCLITHITGIWMFTTMLSGNYWLNALLDILHSMNAHHHICTDVLLAHSVE